MKQGQSASEIQQLLQLIYKTIPNVEAWGAVIKKILRMTGASKGIMALRHDASSDFVVPSQVLSSPLLINFSLEEIGAFVEHYVQFDPWTPIEERHHPDLPYPLSRYLDLADLKASPFWGWLEPQQIDDTVVVDVGQSEGTWVGLNIYFQQADTDVSARVLDLLSSVVTDMRAAWEMGETHRVMTHQTGVRLHEVSILPVSAFFCKADGRTNMVTNRIEELANNPQGLFRSVEPSIRFNDAGHQATFERLLSKAFQTGETVAAPLELPKGSLHLALSKITATEDAIGRRTEQFLGILNNLAEDRTQNILDLAAQSDLTAREQEMFDHLRSSGTIRSFSETFNISTHTADYHWRNLKRKLSIQTPREISGPGKGAE